MSTSEPVKKKKKLTAKEQKKSIDAIGAKIEVCKEKKETSDDDVDNDNDRRPHLILSLFTTTETR